VAAKVSVIILTYNHENYIAEALDSVLAQETDFDFEIVVGDDASADRTPQILSEYAERHPDVLRLILRKHNLGANRNFVEVTRHCQGDYIAMIDGDDYWTRTDKLQTQVDFLDSHPDFAICGHQVEFVYQDDESYRRHFPSLGAHTPPQKEDGNLADALEIVAVEHDVERQGQLKLRHMVGERELFFVCADACHAVGGFGPGVLQRELHAAQSFEL